MATEHHLQKVRFTSSPTETRIHAYPNPFSESTTLRFSLPKRQTVRLSVYDTPGRLITTLLEQTLDAGEYSIPLGNGVLPSSGTYLYRMQTESSVQGGTIFFVR